MNKSKVAFLWFFAILLVAVHPAETKEAAKEVEETEEVRLYFQDGKRVRQKPKTAPKTPVKRLHPYSLHTSSHNSHYEGDPKYILHCSLIFYH